MRRVFSAVLLAALLVGCGDKQTDTPADAPPLPAIASSLLVSPFSTDRSGIYFAVLGEGKGLHEGEVKPFSALLMCNAQWRYLEGREQEFRDFRFWADTANATQDRTSLTVDDIKVTCEADSTIKVATASFPRSLALLTPAGDSREGLVRDPQHNHAFRFFSPAGNLRVVVGETTLDASGSDAGAGTATALQGDKQTPLFGSGEAAPAPYDPAQPVTVAVQRMGENNQPSEHWDVLTVNYKEGWYAWRIAHKKPF